MRCTVQARAGLELTPAQPRTTEACVIGRSRTSSGRGVTPSWYAGCPWLRSGDRPEDAGGVALPPPVGR